MYIHLYKIPENYNIVATVILLFEPLVSVKAYFVVISSVQKSEFGKSLKFTQTISDCWQILLKRIIFPWITNQ